MRHHFQAERLGVVGPDAFPEVLGQAVRLVGPQGMCLVDGKIQWRQLGFVDAKARAGLAAGIHYPANAASSGGFKHVVRKHRVPSQDCFERQVAERIRDRSQMRDLFAVRNGL